jgi:hypothetical protein
VREYFLPHFSNRKDHDAFEALETNQALLTPVLGSLSCFPLSRRRMRSRGLERIQASLSGGLKP